MFRLFVRTSPQANWTLIREGTAREVTAARDFMSLGATRGNQWRIETPTNESTEGAF